MVYDCGTGPNRCSEIAPYQVRIDANEGASDAPVNGNHLSFQLSSPVIGMPNRSSERANTG
jgi:hypothetical protein